MLLFPSLLFCPTHISGDFLAFWEVWGLLPAFSRCSVGVVPHVDVFLIHLWGGRWSLHLTPPPSWRSSPSPFWLPLTHYSEVSNFLNSLIKTSIMWQDYWHNRIFAYILLAVDNFCLRMGSLTLRDDSYLLYCHLRPLEGASYFFLFFCSFSVVLAEESKEMLCHCVSKLKASLSGNPF